MSKIEWTEKTWNPIVGCTVTSPGCKNCYAMEMAARLEAMNAKTGKTPQYEGTTQKVNGKSVWTGKIGIAPDPVWEEPLRRKKPTMYFVNSMGDLFHPNVGTGDIMRAFAVMALAPQHVFQILTKHPERMSAFFQLPDIWELVDFIAQNFDLSPLYNGNLYNGNKVTAHKNCSAQSGLPNVWLGVSVENQKHADERIPILLETPAAVRFISAEPLLGPIDLQWWAQKDIEGDTRRGLSIARLDAVIVGGESGRGARRMHPDWARSLRDQCARAEVPFFFKQWGKIVPHNQMSTECDAPDDVCANLAPSIAPKTLDGVVHNALPESGAA